jgi:hypothetical protein
MEKICEGCGKEFHTYPSRNSRFCSRICCDEHKNEVTRRSCDKYGRRGIKTVCIMCGKEFMTRKDIIKQGNGKFCSRKCHSDSYPGTFIGTRGYRYVRTGNGKHKGEHTLIAEKILGRLLKKGELVHHINGIKTDNLNSNLLICDNQYHNLLHGKMAHLYQKEHFLKGEKKNALAQLS